MRRRYCPNMMFLTHAFRTSSTPKNHATKQTMYDFRAQSLLVNFTSVRLQHHRRDTVRAKTVTQRTTGGGGNPRTRRSVSNAFARVSQTRTDHSSMRDAIPCQSQQLAKLRSDCIPPSVQFVSDDVKISATSEIYFWHS